MMRGWIIIIMQIIANMITIQPHTIFAQPNHSTRIIPEIINNKPFQNSKKPLM